MSQSSEWRALGSLLPALLVAILLASGAITDSSQSTERTFAAPDQTPVQPSASMFVAYFNAVGAATAAADSPDTSLATFLAP